MVWMYNEAWKMELSNGGVLNPYGGISTSGNITGTQIYSNSWFRVNGGGGIYWETHGGGWYMSDNVWLRIYNGKHLYAGNGVIRTDSEFRTGQAGAKFVVKSFDQPREYQFGLKRVSRSLYR